MTQASSTILGTSRDALISADGGRIFLGSSSDLTGGNADGNLDVFVYNVGAGTFTQLTSTTGVHTLSSIVRDADSSQLAFSAMFDPLGSNPDGNSELFLLQTGSQVLSQVTNTNGLGTNRRVLRSTAAGTHLVFTSSFNLTGGNADALERGLPARPRQLGRDNQITSSAVNSFYSDRDRRRHPHPFRLAGELRRQQRRRQPGALAGRSERRRHHHRADRPRPTGSTLAPRVSANGAWVAFPSYADLVGQNADGSFEIFLLEVSSGIFTQISNDPAGGTAPAAINGNGSRVVFTSTSRPTPAATPTAARSFSSTTAWGGPPAVEVPTLGQVARFLLALAIAAAALGLLLLRRHA